MSFTPFLQSVAESLWSRFGNQLSGLTIVLPTRRAKLYLSEYFAKLITTPIWQPKYVTIEELVISSSDLKLVDTYQLLIELYKVYSKHRNVNESFDHFYFWGEAMLSDFSAIDSYRVNAKSLFQNLADQKALDGDFSFLDEEQIQLIQSFWETFNPSARSDAQQKFIEIWDVLYPIYSDFKEALLAKGVAYNGMLLRQLVEDFEAGKLTDTFNGTYVFVGLNALNECEKSLLRLLKKRGEALFYWDYDKYYTADVEQEAGHFIRRNVREFKPEDINDSFQSFILPKDISALASSGKVMQAKSVPLLLEELKDSKVSPSDSLTKTAIVLADETLLMPLLYGLSDEAVNVTMGYPFSQTAVFTLADLLIQLQRNSKTSQNGNIAFYHKDVQAVLSHPYVKALVGAIGEDLLQNIIKNNRVYVCEKFFSDSVYLRQIFSSVPDYSSMIDYLVSIISLVDNLQMEDNVALRREYIYYFVSSIRKLKKAIREERLEVGLPVFLSLLHISLREIRIPFTGEPLSGVQVMGILETRALDFENIIILSFNEGVFPAPISSVSFLPYGLRKGFGLPTVEQHEAMYAYNFYRLVQRAKNVRLIYSTKSDGGEVGEPSRYLYQLKMESGHTVKEQVISYNVTIAQKQSISVPKSDELIEKLQMLSAIGFSPSAISTYITCPLQFYFKYLLGIKELDGVDEDISMVLFGNILHHTMERLYKPYLNEPISKEIIHLLSKDLAKVKDAVNASFAEVYFCTDSLPTDFEQNGRLSIIRDIVVRYVQDILKYDMAKVPFTLRMLEEGIKIPYSFNVNGEVKEVWLKGILDRVDEVNGGVHIVDYKTGKNKQDFRGVDALFADSYDEQNSAVFQTFLYALMYEKMNGVGKMVVPTLYFIRDMHGSGYSAKVVERKSRVVQQEVSDFSFYRKEFTGKLNETLADIFNQHLAFTQTGDPQICASRCPFKLICNR